MNWSSRFLTCLEMTWAVFVKMSCLSATVRKLSIVWREVTVDCHPSVIKIDISLHNHGHIRGDTGGDLSTSYPEQLSSGQNLLLGLKRLLQGILPMLGHKSKEDSVYWELRELPSKSGLTLSERRSIYTRLGWKEVNFGICLSALGVSCVMSNDEAVVK